MPDMEALVQAARAHRSENSRKRILYSDTTICTSSCVPGGSAALQGPEGPVSRQAPQNKRKRQKELQLQSGGGSDSELSVGSSRMRAATFLSERLMLRPQQLLRANRESEIRLCIEGNGCMLPCAWCLYTPKCRNRIPGISAQPVCPMSQNYIWDKHCNRRRDGRAWFFVR